MKNKRWFLRFYAAHEAFIQNLEEQLEHDMITELPCLMDFYREEYKPVTQENWIETRIKVKEAIEQLQEILNE